LHALRGANTQAAHPEVKPGADVIDVLAVTLNDDAPSPPQLAA
jgi:hypothetical protein